MLPSNLILAIEKKEGYNNKILVSNTNMKIGSNRDINKDRKKLSVAEPVARHDPLEVTRSDLRMLTERYNEEKLAIILAILGCGLIAYLLV